MGQEPDDGALPNIRSSGRLGGPTQSVKVRKGANGLPVGLLAKKPTINQRQISRKSTNFYSDNDFDLGSEDDLKHHAHLPPALPAPKPFNRADVAVIQDARRRLAISADSAMLGTYRGMATSGNKKSTSGALSSDQFHHSRSVKGFLNFMHGDEDGHDDPEWEVEATSGPSVTTRAASTSMSGAMPAPPTGLPPEDALMAVASRMGVVRVKSNGDGLVTASAKPRAKASMTVAQVSPLGVAYKAFEKLLDTVRDASLTTAEVVQRVILPATSQLKCRYCDLLSEKLHDSPTFYVVHCWQMSFVSMVEAIRQYVTQLRTNVDDIYIWLDVLCINQHSERTGSDINSIRDVVQASDRVLVLMDRYGTALNRTWCMWEIWQASLSERFDKIVVLSTSWAWEDLLHAYLTLDIGRTMAARDRERLMLMGEMHKASDLNVLANTLREALLTGSKREMQRAEKLASVNPRRFGTAASTYALLLTLHCRYGEAEDIMRQVMRLYDRAGAREVTEKDCAAATYQLSCILRDQGRLPDAERVLQEFVNQFRGMQDELYMDGVGALADILTQRQFYTKAEMLSRKMLEEKVKVYGAEHHQVIKSMLQLASIAVAQKLYEEGESHLREVLKHVSATYQGETADSAAAYHTLALCTFYSNRLSEAKMLIEKALVLRTKLFGLDHPATLDSKAFQAEMMIKEKRAKEAEGVLMAIFKCRNRSYGGEHHATLASMGQLADLLRDLRKDDEADEMEKRLIAVGRQLLRYTKIDKFMSLNYVTNYLAKRDHLLDKAAMFLAKAYIVFKEKLGGEHELCTMTKSQLAEIISKVKWIGNNALEQAQIFNSSTQFGVAEVMFKQAYSISKLVSPEADHKPLAQGLADALFGQGKVQEAKTIMRAAGLVRKGMKQNMPASYLRWLNTRVAKYMDAHGGDEDDAD